MVYQKAATGDPISLDDPKAGALSMSTPLANFSDVSTDPIRMFARRDAYRTVAEAIAGNIAAVPFDLYQRDDVDGRTKVSADTDPLAAALQDPSPGMTTFRLVESLQLDHVLWDRWAVLILRTETGAIRLVRLPARRISFALDGFGLITDVVVYAANGDRKFVPIEHCLFDVGYDPQLGGKETSGFSVSNTLEAAATELERGAHYRALLLAGGPKVPMYIKRPANAPDWAKNGGYDRFKKDFTGYSTDKAGQVPILDDGMELAAAPQLLQDSVQYRETRLAAQVEFALAMHYPPELIGYRTGTNSNIESLREQLYVDVLGGRITAFRQAINSGLRRAGLLGVGEYVEENLGVRLASSPVKQASLLQTQVGAPVRTVNEARRMLNLSTVPYGDDLIVPLNVTKGGLASPTDTGPKTLSRSAPQLKAITEGATPPQYKSALAAMTDRFAAELSSALTQQAARVDAGLGSGSSPGSLADAFDLAAENAALAAVIFAHSYALAGVGAEAVLVKFNPEHEGFAPEVMQPWLLKAAQSTADQINTATVGKLAAVLFEPDWRAAADGVLAALVGARAGVWARTVSTASISFGANDAARTSGLTRKSWAASDGSRHAHLAGETVDISAPFSNGMRWPGDPTAPAQETAGCSCSVEYSRETTS